MSLLRFRNTAQIVQNLRVALRLAEEKHLEAVAARLRIALKEAEDAEKELRKKTVISGTKSRKK